MIIFMGLAGSGKSTQGQVLAKHLGCVWLSTGQLLREQVKDPQIIQEMLKGEVLDDKILLPLLGQELKRLRADQKEVILDGSPRTIAQAHWLVNKIKAKEIKLTAVIHLQTSEATARARLLGRGRPDDKEGAIAERFHEYKEAIIPILHYLRSQGLVVHDINGEQSPAAVEDDVLKALSLK